MNKETVKVFFKICIVIVLLYFFLLSIGLMGASFKGFGKGFAENLIKTTANPFVGLFIGVFATSLVQSSSTTTSIVVGIVGSGGLTVATAIPIIMGANIGTTVTNTLVSLGHVGRKDEFKRAIAGATVHDFFNLICVAIMFPLELATGFLTKAATAMSGMFENAGGIKMTSPIKAITKPVIHWVKDASMTMFSDSTHATYIFMLILSIVVLFFALYFIVKVMKSVIAARAEIVLNNVVTKNGFLSLIAGLLFTIFVQSSSITTSLLIPLVAAGILSVKAIFPITMGANIGTTTTAILASFATGNISAITIAFAHFLFNVIGVVCIYPVKMFRVVPIQLATGLGNIAAEKKRYAFLYVLGLFFIVPAVLIIVSKLFN